MQEAKLDAPQSAKAQIMKTSLWNATSYKGHHILSKAHTPTSLE